MLTAEPPDAYALAVSMAEADPHLHVHEAGSGAMIQLCDDEGVPLVAIEAAQRVGVAAEVERLLGEGVAEGLTASFWWVRRARPGISTRLVLDQQGCRRSCQRTPCSGMPSGGAPSRVRNGLWTGACQDRLQT